MVGANPEKVKEIIDQFIDETPSLLPLLRKKTDQRQWAEAMIITNKVKTRYSYFGFDDIFDILHQLEETFKKEKETEKLPAILDNFYGITSEIIEELKELDQYKNIKAL